MKFQTEIWSGWKLGAEYVRHTQADRYTVRAGRLGLSILVSYRMPDDIATKLMGVAFALVGFFVGVLVSTV